MEKSRCIRCLHPIEYHTEIEMWVITNTNPNIEWHGRCPNDSAIALDSYQEFAGVIDIFSHEPADELSLLVMEEQANGRL